MGKLCVNHASMGRVLVPSWLSEAFGVSWQMTKQSPSEISIGTQKGRDADCLAAVLRANWPGVMDSLFFNFLGYVSVPGIIYPILFVQFVWFGPLWLLITFERVKFSGPWWTLEIGNKQPPVICGRYPQWKMGGGPEIPWNDGLEWKKWVIPPYGGFRK